MEILTRTQSRTIGNAVKDAILRGGAIGFAVDPQATVIVLVDDHSVNLLVLRSASSDDIHYLVNNAIPTKAVFNQSSILKTLRRRYHDIQCHAFIDVQRFAHERGLDEMIQRREEELRLRLDETRARIAARPFVLRETAADRRREQLYEALIIEAQYAYNIYHQIQTSAPVTLPGPQPRFTSICLFRTINNVNHYLIEAGGEMSEEELMTHIPSFEEIDRACLADPDRGENLDQIQREVVDFLIEHGFVVATPQSNGSLTLSF